MDKKEPYDAETQWIHIFKSLVFSGDLAQIGAHAVSIYIAIKSHVDFVSGHAFPEIKTIMEYTGLSKSKVLRELEILEAYGYLKREKVGRQNRYTLREKIIVKDGEEPTAIATWDYIPAMTKQAIDELKNFTVTKDENARTVTINIQRITIEHLYMIDHDYVQGNSTTQFLELQKLDPAIRDSLLRIRRKLDKEGDS